MLTRLPSARLQCFLDDGKPNANGFLYTYALGTTTPKATYYDIYGIAPQSNPINLDSAGTAPVYLFGSYTIWQYDSTSAQVGPPVDIEAGLNDSIITSGSGGFANNQFLLVNTYADVRAITDAYALVYVQGRVNQADGGEGLFYLDQSSTDSDDDGITLTPNVTGRYIRYNVETIDPRWFGLVYNTSIDQGIYLTKSAQASQRYAKDVEIDGSTYLNQNYTTSAYNSTWRFTSNAKMISTAGITFTFTSNTFLIECCSKVWGLNVQPIFQTGVTEAIKYSWVDASNDEGRVTKWINSSTVPNVMEMDKQVNITLDFILPSYLSLYVPNGSTSGTININGTGKNVTIPNITDGSSKVNIINFQNLTTVGNISVPAGLSPEFFSANGTGLSADDIPLFASLKSGNFNLVNKYLVGSSTLTIPNQVIINGPSNLLSENFVNDITNISLIPSQSIILQSISGVSGTSAAEINFNNLSELNYVNIFGTSGSNITSLSASFFNTVYTQISGNIGNFQNLILTNSYTIGNISATNSIVNSSIISGTLYSVNPVTVDKSIISNVTNVNTVDKSTFTNFSGNVFGNISNSTINAISQIYFSEGLTHSYTNFLKSNTYDISGVPLSNFSGTLLQFNFCNFNLNGPIHYSVSTTTTLKFVECTSVDNWTNAVSNGYSIVDWQNSQPVQNTSFTYNNGLYISTPIAINTNLTACKSTSEILTHWRGYASACTQSFQSITTSADIALSNDYRSRNTIRYYGTVQDNYLYLETINPIILLIKRYGGVAITQFDYPSTISSASSAFFPNVKVIQPTYLLDGSPITGWLTDVDSGLCNSYNYLPKNGSVKLQTNIWIGQRDIIQATGDHHYTDQWGDIDLHYVPGTAEPINNIMFVILNSGALSAACPNGTKITQTIYANLPNGVVNYKAFFPVPVYQGNFIGIPDGQVLLTHNQIYRNADYAGLQVSNMQNSNSPGQIPITTT